MFVCPEVAEAVRGKTLCPGIERLAHYAADDPELVTEVMECWFCPACVAGHKLPPSGPVPDPDGFLNAHSALYRPMCPGCFEEWRWSSGQRSAASS
jgi:hypothetical protein